MAFDIFCQGEGTENEGCGVHVEKWEVKKYRVDEDITLELCQECHEEYEPQD